MKKCARCNLSYDDDKKFCKKCGDPLASEYLIEPKAVAKKSVFEDRLRADPLNIEILHEYAQFLFNNLLFKEAITVSLKILAINENDGVANELLFKSYFKLDMLKEALEIGKQLLYEKPTDIFLLQELAEISGKMGNANKATEYYGKVLSLKPTNSAALYNKAQNLLAENQLEKAIDIFRNLHMEGQNDRITTIYAGIDKALTGDYKTAIKLLSQILDNENQNDVNTNRRFLYLAYSLCQSSAGLPEIKRWAVKINYRNLKQNYHPLDEQTVFKIAEFIIYKSLNEINSPLAANNQFKNLIETYLQKDNFTKNYDSKIADLWYAVGSKYVELKLFADALNSFQKAVDLCPNEHRYQQKCAENEKLLEAGKREKNIKTKKVIVASAVITIIILIFCGAYFCYDNYFSHRAVYEKNKERIISKSKRFESNLEELEGKYHSFPSDNYYNDAMHFEIKKEDKGCGLLLYGYYQEPYRRQEQGEGYLYIENNSLRIGEDPSVCDKDKNVQHAIGATYGVQYGSNPVYYDPVNKALVLSNGIFYKDSAGKETHKEDVTPTPPPPLKEFVKSDIKIKNEKKELKNEITSPRDIVIEKPTPALKETNTITDIDGNVYHTVTIGSQVWMVENLKTTKYNDGTSIPQLTSMAEWDNLQSPGYCWCNSDPANKNTYGALYKWHTVNTGKLAPKGWHVPTDAEWTTLITFLGGEVVAGGKLKQTGTSHWQSPNKGATNETGFTALPGGLREYDGRYGGFGGGGYWWSSTESNTSYAWRRGLFYVDPYANRDHDSKNCGFSVRCVRDNSESTVLGEIRPNSDNYDKEKLKKNELKNEITTPKDIVIEKPTPALKETNTITDIDGNVYHYITIGTQVWMVENLKTTKYNDGTSIPNITNNTEWENLATPGYCWYNNEVGNKKTYGALYNWHTVNTGKLAPKGWHIPTDAEWSTLVTFLGGASLAGGKLKETGTSHWESPNTGATNETGFTALPGGIRGGNGEYSVIGNRSCWLCSDMSGLRWTLYASSSQAYFSRSSESFGISVRCVRD